MLFTWVCLATGASVHRRGRCTGVLLSLGYGLSLVFVLVCLSIDVTGALVLPNSFCFARFFLLHAPPFSVLLSFRLSNLPRSCCVCAVLLLLVCPVLLCLCCPVVLVSSCYLWRRGLVVSVGFVLLAVLVRASVFPVLPALPCCASFCALVQLTLLCAGASLGVSGCSCDGSVALLSCWECGLA